MAKCPNCGFGLKPWHFRAECPSCKVNIPNFDWVNRLEEDSIVAEAAHLKLKRNITNLKYAFVGTKLRMVRLPVSFLPLFSFLLPFFGAEFRLPFFEGSKSYSLITLTMEVAGFDFSAISGFLSSPITGRATAMFLGSIVLVYLAFLSLFVSLFFLLRNYKNLKSKGLFFTNLFGTLCLVGSGLLSNAFSSMTAAGTMTAFAGTVRFGLWVSAGLFLASSVINLMVAKSKAALPEPEDKDAQEELIRKAKEIDRARHHTRKHGPTKEKEA